MSGDIPILYHYCSIETFKSIIKNKQLWLSNIWRTNDYKEMTWCKDIIIPIYKDIFGENLDEKYFNHYNYNNNGVFISCFSSVADLLSQWRAYGDDGTGIAIGFDFTCLNLKQSFPINSVIRHDSVAILQVIYDELIQKSIILKEMHKLKISSYFQSKEATGYMIASLGKYAPYFKNPCFFEEMEWRIVFRDPFYGVKFDDNTEVDQFRHFGKLQYYRQKNKTIEYYELSFAEFLCKNVLKRIILGPKCLIEEQQIRKYLLDYCFEKNLIDSIIIDRSKASYR